MRVEPGAVVLSEDFHCLRCGSQEDLVLYALFENTDHPVTLAVCQGCDQEES